MTTLRAYLQLMRLPAVFTAMADLFMGFVLAGHTIGVDFDSSRILGLGLLLVSSSCLYLSGMVFNDLFDRHIDAVERPQRPIPSGRISAKAAGTLGGLLVLVGIGAAVAVGWQSLVLALILTAAIFLYDGFLKKTPLGPLSMGACRSLNILLGASYAPVGASAIVLARPQVPVAIAMGIYVAGVTWFARQEEKESSRGHLVGATSVINLGLLALALRITGVPGLFLARIPPGDTNRYGVLLTLAVIALILNRRLVGAILNPIPGKVQPAVKTLLLSIIFIDATLIFYQTNNAETAMMTAALIVPALLLGRWVFVT